MVTRGINVNVSSMRWDNRLAFTPAVGRDRARVSIQVLTLGEQCMRCYAVKVTQEVCLSKMDYWDVHYLYLAMLFVNEQG